jgi:hypothetical protein
MTTHTELHPLLDGAPSLATATARTLNNLYQHLALLQQLGDRLKVCTHLREPDKYGEQYSPDQHLRKIEDAIAGSTQRLREAYNLITTRGVSRGGA